MFSIQIVLAIGLFAIALSVSLVRWLTVACYKTSVFSRLIVFCGVIFAIVCLLKRAQFSAPIREVGDIVEIYYAGLAFFLSI